MPLTFPSHQGLVAPLWRRWPGRFHVLGLCIGAAMPDLVDGVLGAWRGYLGQWYGHTLVGLAALCLPFGLLLTWGTVLAGGRLARSAARRLAWLGRGVGRLDNIPPEASLPRRVLFVALSLSLGAFSHLVFDLVSHGHFRWLYPWYESSRLFPCWWYIEWFALAVPGYREPYPIGPPVLVWVVLSVVGIVVLFWPWLSSRERV